MQLNLVLAKKIESKLNDYFNNVAKLTDQPLPVFEKLFLVASVRDGAKTTQTRMFISELTSSIIFDLLRRYIDEQDKTNNKRTKATPKKKNNSKKL